MSVREPGEREISAIDPVVPDLPRQDIEPPPHGLPVTADPVIGSVVADDWGRVPESIVDPGTRGQVVSQPITNTDTLSEADID